MIKGWHFEKQCVISSMMKHGTDTRIPKVMKYTVGGNSYGVNSTMLINGIWPRFRAYLKIFGLNCLVL